LVRYALVVLHDALVSNADVARALLRRRDALPTGGFIRVPLELEEPGALAALAIVTTIVPGTVWCELANDRRAVLLHVFDPGQDEAAFVAHYVADHPRLEARFPRIRSIMCYFPLAAPVSRRVPCADYMLGNEVVFDCVEDFNAAMRSPVRHEMRAHFHSFPKFSGAVTHFAMLRERLVG